jgi:hypothetical protein
MGTELVDSLLLNDIDELLELLELLGTLELEELELELDDDELAELELTTLELELLICSLDELVAEEELVDCDDEMRGVSLDSRIATASVLSALAIIEPTTTAEIVIDKIPTINRIPWLDIFCMMKPP